MTSSKHDKTRHPAKREKPLGDEHVSTVNMPPRPRVRLPARSGVKPPPPPKPAKPIESDEGA